MNNYNLKLSESNSITISIIRIITTQLIALTHGLENIGAIDFANPIGISSLNFLMLISGLLISYSTFSNMKKPNYDFKKFFLKRFSRIYTVLFAIFPIIILLDWINHYKFFNHIPTFIINIFLLNDSALGYPFYGFNRHLWIFPLFWWQYLFFAWFVLGKRTTGKKSIFFAILLFFTSIIIIILLGICTERKIMYLIIWYIGVSFSYFVNKLNHYIKRKSIENNIKNEQKEAQLKRKIKSISILLCILFFILAILRAQTNISHDAYELLYNLCLAAGVLFFLVFAQFSKFKFPKKFKKGINFLASYSLTMFLFHMCLYNLVLKFGGDLILFIFMHIIANLLSLAIASLTERRSKKVYSFLFKKFNLDANVKKKKKKTISNKIY
jgi:peptidoglycan/LPS O-acetylase OafA/YrhL